MTKRNYFVSLLIEKPNEDPIYTPHRISAAYVQIYKGILMFYVRIGKERTKERIKFRTTNSSSNIYHYHYNCLNNQLIKMLKDGRRSNLNGKVIYLVNN